MNEKRYFTASEINALIPQLEHIFDHIQTCKARAEELAAKSMRGLGSADASEAAQAQLMRSQAEFLMEAVEDDVLQIEKLGGTTKDVEIGLVDFPGDVDGHDVWLCWKRGETAVRFWHAIDAGFAQRRALPIPGRDRIH